MFVQSLQNVMRITPALHLLSSGVENIGYLDCLNLVLFAGLSSRGNFGVSWLH